MKDEYTLEKLFNDYRGGIRIPHIQREYAQGRQDERGEIIRRTFVPELVRAVLGRKPLSLDFIYGVSDETSALLPLDGQQRLTTLFLLAWCCGKWHGDWRFSYESRRIPELFVQGLIAHPRHPGTEAAAQIREAEWFLPVWEKDPTVAGMLKMAETIDKVIGPKRRSKAQIDNVRFFLHVLDGGKVGFDRIFRKMNARGKELTPWENLKAVLDDTVPVDMAVDWKEKIDGEWSETTWEGVGGDIARLDRFMEQIVRVAYARFTGWSHFDDALDQIEQRLSEMPEEGKEYAPFSDGERRDFYETVQTCFSVLRPISCNWAEERNENALWSTKHDEGPVSDSEIWDAFGGNGNPSVHDALRLLYLAKGCSLMTKQTDVHRKIRVLLNIVDVEMPDPDKFDAWCETGLDFLQGKFGLLSDRMTKTFGDSTTGQLADERRKWHLPELDVVTLECDELVHAGSLRFVGYDEDAFDSAAEIRNRLDRIRAAIESDWFGLFDNLFARIALTWNNGIPGGRTIPIPRDDKRGWRDEFLVRVDFFKAIHDWLKQTPSPQSVPAYVAHVRALHETAGDPLGDFQRMKEADGWLWLIVGARKRTESAIRLDWNDNEAINRKNLLVEDAIRYRDPWPWFESRVPDIWYRVDVNEPTWWETTCPTKYHKTVDEEGNENFEPMKP